MESLIANALEKALGPYKSYSIIFFIIYILINFLTQMYFNYRVTKKVETFKNVLKKSEIKFSKHSELQIECLKTMYNNIVDLHFGFARLLSNESINHNLFKENSLSLIFVFSQNMEYFHRNKILLTDDIINQARILHIKFKVIEESIEIQLVDLSKLEDYHSTDDPQILYGTPDNENESVKKKINFLNTISEVNTFENEIKRMRDLVEKYFRSLL